MAMIDEIYLYERLESFEQSDEEEMEVIRYAQGIGLELWTPMDTLVFCIKYGQKDYTIPNWPIVPSDRKSVV